ncbi:class I SAM-dependent methyltransferase [Ornithinibacillus sp. 179-J 7C1 HS]|uniref:class I SAM-dependent methyltransferase n=1 Tax=Ornithinibacillus sp. 179-J 7C1 HS TaxID=3142384 RepID=UPI0039A1AFCB
MSDCKIETIVGCMGTTEETYQIQKIQTEHRIRLVDSWNIKAGSKILEIGCGQGDTTAVLAYYTGEEGFVQAIDIGSPAYGAPITLGESAEYLMNSALGKQIKIEFNVDVLSPDVHFLELEFDYIVFSHCSWYTKSTDELLQILKKVKSWGKQLCFAEWSTTISSIEQYPHLLAILIQAQYESFKEESVSNVRTLLTPKDIRALAEEAGWNVQDEITIDSPELQDGKWEVDMLLYDVHQELNKLNNMPAKLKDLIRSEVQLLEAALETGEIKPLSVYSFIAE